MDYLRLPIGNNAPESFNVVVEIPKGSANKYEYDKELNVFRLDRALYSPTYYPGDYGFIPSTISEDGDPLDALVLVDEPSFTGCLIHVRPVGILEMIDQGLKDEKVLAVPVYNPRFSEVIDFSGIFAHVLREIEHFFLIYKELEGKKVESQGWRSTSAAREIIRQAHERFKQGIV